MLITYVNFGACGGVMVLGLLLPLLVFVSIRLVQFREGALGLAGYLLLLEFGGGVLMMAMGNYFGFRDFDSLLTWAVIAGVVGLVWTLPNALVLYTQRAKFVEQAKK
jgi:hypothetical protein